jgi:hypothetical protein
LRLRSAKQELTVTHLAGFSLDLLIALTGVTGT